MTDTHQRILIVGPSWVGDMVMAQSLCRSLKQADPEAQIDMLALGWSLPLIERMPEVRRGIEFPSGHGEFGLRKLWRLGRSLAGQYDRAIVLPRKFKSALVPFFARIPRRTGFRGESRYFLINDCHVLDERVLKKNVERYVALGTPRGAALPPPILNPRLQSDPARQREVIGALGLHPEQPAIALLPGAEFGPAKQWPAAHYGELARSLAGQGYQVWILGSKKEEALGAQVLAGANAGGVHNLCGRTTLTDVVDLLSVCRAAVGNDSGLMHMAAASGIPLVGIYGSTPPDFAPPLSDHARLLYLGISCSPCRQRICPLGHTRCLHDIHPSQVLSALADSGVR